MITTSLVRCSGVVTRVPALACTAQLPKRLSPIPALQGLRVDVIEVEVAAVDNVLVGAAVGAGLDETVDNA